MSLEPCMDGPLARALFDPAFWSVAAMYSASDLRHVVPRALMKSAGGRVPINGTHFEVLWSELGVPFRVLPSLCHHLTLRLTISGPAGSRPAWPFSVVSCHGAPVAVAPPE